MPLSVLNSMDADHVVLLQEMEGVISDTLKNIKGRKKAVPKDVIAESQVAEQTAVGIENIRKLDVVQSVYACPDCGGPLWEPQNDIIKRYRCHIGHGYTERGLVLKQAETAEATLWVALRMMEERKNLLKKMQMDYADRGTNLYPRAIYKSRKN